MPIDDAITGGDGITSLVVHLPLDTALETIKKAMWRVTRQALNGIDPEGGRFDNFSPGPILIYSRKDDHYRVILQFPMQQVPWGVTNTASLYDSLIKAEGAHTPTDAAGCNTQALIAIGRY